MKLSTRTRRLVVAAGVALLSTAGIASAQAEFLGLTSASVTTSNTFALPVVPTTYHSVAGGKATLYTPNLQGGMVTVSVTSAVGSAGVIVASTGFSCPSDAPNPLFGISLAGGSGSITVKARITGTTKLYNGEAAAYDVAPNPVKVELGSEAVPLYSVCSG